MGNGLHARVLAHGHQHIGLRVGEFFHVAIGEHHIGDGIRLGMQIHARGHAIVDGALEALEDQLLHVFGDGVAFGFGGNAGFHELRAIGDQRIDGLQAAISSCVR